jgi:hypothetical protein
MEKKSESSDIQTTESAPSDRPSISDLPTKVLLKIFSYLNVPELCKHVAPVCKAWNALSKDKSLWTHLEFQEFAVPTRKVIALLKRSPHLKRLVLLGRSDVSDVLRCVLKHNFRLKSLILDADHVTADILHDILLHGKRLRYVQILHQM